MLVMVLLSLSCIHHGIGIPGSTRFLGKDMKVQWQEYNVEEHQEQVEEPPSKNQSIIKTNQQKIQKDTVTPTVNSNHQKIQKKLVQAAQSFLGAKKLLVEGEAFRYDCSGFVAAVYAKAGIPIVSGSSGYLQEQSKKYNVFSKNTTPNIGDVVFFNNTYDRNKNGKRDDGVTHVGIVEAVDATGLITMIHLGNTGIVRIYMNFTDPNRHNGFDGELWNSYLRVNKKNDHGPNLAGQLWSGFASFWKLPPNTL